MSTVEHLTVDDGIGCLTPDDELEEIELGTRVSMWLAYAEVSAFSYHPADDSRGIVSMMVGQAAQSTSHIGLPFPGEWWPPSAGAWPR